MPDTSKLRPVLLVVSLVACGQAQPLRTKALYETTLASAPAKLTSGDPATVRGTLRNTVIDGGLWFDDPACRKQFATSRIIGAAELDAFSSCVAGLKLSTSPRFSLPNVAVLTYEPGVELEAWFAIGPGAQQLLWLGFAGSREIRSWLPTITPETLQTLRVSGDPSAVEPDSRAMLDAEAAKTALGFVSAQFKVCIDHEGTVASAHAFASSSLSATRAFRAAIGTWRFHPLILGGQAMAACAIVDIDYPAAKVPASVLPVIEIPPLDPTTEGVPIGKPVRKDDRPCILDRDQMSRLAKGVHLVSAVQFCTDASGAIAKVNVYASTGLPKFDEQIVSRIWKRRYEPSIVDGRPVPACNTAVCVWVNGPLSGI